jgi:N-acetylneuraminic acid mutarotase
MLQTGTKVIIWGGRAGKDTYYNDGAIYDIASREWSEISEAPVDPRCAHTSFLLGSKLVIWGGDGEEGPYNDGAIYDLSTGKWQKIAKSPLGPRLAHVSILSGSKLLIWGGAGEDEYYDDGAIYDISADKWRKISSSPLSARSGHTAILCGSKVIVWGGVCEKRWGGMLKKVHCTDGAVYDLATDRWQKLPDSPLKGRWGLTPILYNKRLIMWGGVDKERDYNDGAIYEISRGVWEGIPEAPVGGRYNCELALSGSRLVVWGGVPKTQWYQTWYADGATYDMETGEWEELEEAPIEGRDPCTFFVLKLRSGLQQKAEGHDPRCPWEQECEGCRKRVKRSIKAILRDQEASGEWKGNHGGTDLTQLLTSISGLALISTGSTHKEGRYKTEISKALEAVLKGIKRAEAGAFHRGFQRSFVLLFLSEVYMRDPDERIKRAASILIKRLRRSQLRNGGWGYDPDISSFRYDHFAATAAILIALCVAKDAGFDVPAGMIKKAIRYVERCANKDGSFTYTLTPVLPGGRRIIRQGESPDRCGTAVCALLFAKPDSKKIKPGLRYFIDNLDRVILNKVRPEGGLFNRFFNSVMMYKLGGAMGKKWEKQLREKGVTGGFGGFEAQVELISLVLYRGGLKIFAKR